MMKNLVLYTMLILLIGSGCAYFSKKTILEPVPRVPAKDLLLNVEAFPKGWIIDPCGSDCSRTQGDIYAERSFGVLRVPGHVLQEVSFFGKEEDAQLAFQTYRETEFRKSPPPQTPSSEFLPPSFTSYYSLIADQYYLGCGVDIVPACRAIIRYNNYLVSFFFNIDQIEVNGTKYQGNGLKPEEIEPILRSLDEQVSAYLGIALPLTKPTPIR